MPELPEIRAHAERLDARFGGVRQSGFRALAFTALKTVEPSPEAADGHAVGTVGSRGKHLLLGIGPVHYVVHLMQGGRLKPDERQSAKPRNGLARWTFEDGQALLLTEAGSERRAGVWVVSGDPEAQPPLDHLGPDADSLTLDQLAEQLEGSSRRLHGWLRDQQALAGVGRRLANEICHRARLSPFAGSGGLDDDEVARLHEALVACIDESLAEERGREEMSAAKDRSSAVHHRAGEPCPVCGDEVRAVEYAKYTVNYCATCQTGGKVLADNTTSKFLK